MEKNGSKQQQQHNTRIVSATATAAVNKFITYSCTVAVVIFSSVFSVYIFNNPSAFTQTHNNGSGSSSNSSVDAR